MSSSSDISTSNNNNNYHHNHHQLLLNPNGAEQKSHISLATATAVDTIAFTHYYEPLLYDYVNDVAAVASGGNYTSDLYNLTGTTEQIEVTTQNIR